MLLVTGLFFLGEAFGTSGPGTKWRRTNVRLGRLSSFAGGLWFGAVGVAFLGYGWATECDQIWGFNAVSARQGLAIGEEGFARLRDGRVVDLFITAVVGLARGRTRSCT
jgi:hypothetical protein